MALAESGRPGDLRVHSALTSQRYHSLHLRLAKLSVVQKALGLIAVCSHFDDPVVDVQILLHSLKPDELGRL